MASKKQLSADAPAFAPVSTPPNNDETIPVAPAAVEDQRAVVADKDARGDKDGEAARQRGTHALARRLLWHQVDGDVGAEEDAEEDADGCVPDGESTCWMPPVHPTR